MPITNISRDWGTKPGIVRVTTTDNLAAITAANYLDTQVDAINDINHGVFQWVEGDLAGIDYSDGDGFFTYSSNDNTFVAASGGGGLSDVLPQNQVFVGSAANIATPVAMSGDVAIVAAGTTTIQPQAVTYAKIQNVSATDKVLGRSTSGAGVTEEIPCTAAGRAIIAAANAAAQRTAIGAAASGANTDITSVYLNNTGLKVKDTDASHGLTFVPGSNLTADRTLTFGTGDNNRTLDISAADTTISVFGASLVDDANAAAGRTTLGAAASGANTDITSVYLNNTGLKVKDTDASHGLSFVPGSNLTADRVLTITTGDAARTLDISAANTTVSAFGASLVDDASATVARATLGIALYQTVTTAVQVTKAQMQNCVSVPIVIIPAPGAGLMNNIIGISSAIYNQTVQYSGVASMAYYYGADYNTVFFMNEPCLGTPVVLAQFGANPYASSIGYSSYTPNFVNAPFVLTNASGSNPTISAGDGTLVVYASYSVVPAL